MKRLFFTALLFFYAECFALELPNLDSKSSGQTASQSDSSAGTSGNKIAEKSTAQNLFLHGVDQKMAEGDRIKQPVIERAPIDTDQMQAIIDKLPESDKKVLTAMRTQIAAWPAEIFDEISSYREFVINARKIAQQKYDALSQEAKSALEYEKQLKTQLSKKTLQQLEALDASALN